MPAATRPAGEDDTGQEESHLDREALSSGPCRLQPAASPPSVAEPIRQKICVIGVICGYFNVTEFLPACSDVCWPESSIVPLTPGGSVTSADRPAAFFL
jgi:hypothetical protein